jgi:hypothetical protein
MGLPIQFVASGGSTSGTNGLQAAHSMSFTQATAVTGEKIAVIAYLAVSSASSLSAATATATYGGQAMTAQKLVYGPGGQNQSLIVFRLLDAPTGSQTVSFSITGMTTNLVAKQYSFGCAVYRNVYGITTPAGTGAGGSTTVTTRSQTFSNVIGRDVCVGVHGREDGTAFSAYTLNQRESSGRADFSRGLIGDSIGRGGWGTVASTTTSSVTDHQACFGLRLLADPSVISVYAASTNTITIPHEPGDLLVMFAQSSTNNTYPAAPAAGGTVPAWTTLNFTNAGGWSNSRTAWAVGTGSSTSGTWTTTGMLVVAVIPGANAIGGRAMSAIGLGGTMTAPAVSMTQTDGTSSLLHFYGIGDGVNAIGTISAPAAGYTRYLTFTPTNVLAAVVNVKDVSTSDGALVQSKSGPTYFVAATVEALAGVSLPVTPTNQFFTMF